MEALNCVNCGGALSEFVVGVAKCEYCGSRNKLKVENGMVSISVDGKVPVLMPWVIVVAMYLRKKGFLIMANVGFHSWYGWNGIVTESSDKLRIGEEKISIIFYRKIDIWASLIFSGTEKVKIRVRHEYLEKAKEIGGLIKKDLLLPVRIEVISYG